MWNYGKQGNFKGDEHICSSASEFMHSLIDLPRMFPEHNKHNSSSLIYRGHSNSEWLLLPSILRENEHKKVGSLNDGLIGIDFQNPPSNELGIREAEYEIIRHFYRISENAGFSLPKISAVLHQDLASNETSRRPLNYTSWPPTELYPVLALAQHYGLPTRLLDWSTSPLIAAYFAASNAAKTKNSESQNEYFCVWAAKTNQFTGQPGFNENGDAVPDRYPYPVRILRPPSGENPNLKLQNGIFTVALDSRINLTGEEKINRTPHNLYVGPKREGHFFKLVISTEYAVEILFRLQQLNIGANTLFDGFSGSAKAVEEHALIGLNVFNRSKDDPYLIREPIEFNEYK